MDDLVLQHELIEIAGPDRGVELQHGGVDAVAPVHAVRREPVGAAAADREIATVQVIVPDGEQIVVARLPVQAREHVRARSRERLLAEGSRVRAVRLQDRDEPRRGIGVDACGPRRVHADVRPRVRRSPRLVLGGHEKVQPVLDDRPAERPAVLVLLELPERQAGLIVPHQAFVLASEERRAVEGVRAPLRDGVDQPPRETALAHVKRSDEHLIL